MLWLWHRPAATALIRPLAWEPPYAMSEALKKKKRSGTEKCKMSLEYLSIPESKDAIKVHWSHVKRTQSQLQEASLLRSGASQRVINRRV